jgi:hypothetical protein
MYTIYMNTLTIGMLVLLAWASWHLWLWWHGRHRDVGQVRGFRRQMDAIWNSVNVVLALGALSTLLLAVPMSWLTDALIAKIIAVNVLGDIVYTACGYYMSRKPSLRLRGYGQSLMVQGAFLWLLDSTMLASMVIAT